MWDVRAIRQPPPERRFRHTGPWKWGATVRREVVAAYLAGASTLEVEETMGVSASHVRTILAEAGVSCRPLAVARRLARARGRDPLRRGPVYRLPRAPGCTAPAASPPVTRFEGVEANEVAAWYEDGRLSLSAIARRKGCGAMTVRRTLLRMGVALRSRSDAVRLAWEARAA